MGPHGWVVSLIRSDTLFHYRRYNERLCHGCGIDLYFHVNLHVKRGQMAERYWEHWKRSAIASDHIRQHLKSHWLGSVQKSAHAKNVKGVLTPGLNNTILQWQKVHETIWPVTELHIQRSFKEEGLMLIPSVSSAKDWHLSILLSNYSPLISRESDLSPLFQPPPLFLILP